MFLIFLTFLVLSEVDVLRGALGIYRFQVYCSCCCVVSDVFTLLLFLFLLSSILYSLFCSWDGGGATGHPLLLLCAR